MFTMFDMCEGLIHDFTFDKIKLKQNNSIQIDFFFSSINV